MRSGWGAPSGARQAAADGNQWIFGDIGLRYAAFLELYRSGGQPSTAELQRFFDDSFGDGDAQIRAAFAAYAQVPLTEDPQRRQELMFRGNVLIAMHEQAGAQPYLEDVSVGPDRVATRYIELRIGDRVIHVNQDLPPVRTTNNLLQPRPFLDLDPAGLSPHQLAPQALAGITLAQISGIDDKRFPLSLARMSERGGGTTQLKAVTGSPYPIYVRVTVPSLAVVVTAGPCARDLTAVSPELYQLSPAEPSPTALVSLPGAGER